MQIKLRSGTVITDDVSRYLLWKSRMKVDCLITYSTDTSGLIMFWSSEISEILLSAEEIAATMHE